jgi:hypothetical protein
MAGMSDAPIGEYLSAAELHTLTGYAWSRQHAAWLKLRGIAHRTDGRRVIVSREHVRAWLEGRVAVTSSGVNWAAVK